MKTPAVIAILAMALIPVVAIAAPPSKGQPRLPSRERATQPTEAPMTMCAECLALQRQGARGPVMVDGRECDPTKRCHIVRKAVTRANGKARALVEECICA